MSQMNSSRKLELLLKLSQNKTDQIRLEISQCLAQINTLTKKKSEIITDRKKEESFATEDDTYQSTLTLNAYRTNQDEKLLTTIKEAQLEESRYESLQEKLRELFTEQKAYDLAINHLKRQDEESQKRKELIFMDEISSQKWHKNL